MKIENVFRSNCGSERLTHIQEIHRRSLTELRQHHRDFFSSHNESKGVVREMNAIYARQSLDKKDSLSIEGQIELCAVSAQPEYIIYQDRGFSGKNTQRPAFQQLMQDVVAGKIQKFCLPTGPVQPVDCRFWTSLETVGGPRCPI